MGHFGLMACAYYQRLNEAVQERPPLGLKTALLNLVVAVVQAGLVVGLIDHRFRPRPDL